MTGNRFSLSPVVYLDILTFSWNEKGNSSQEELFSYNLIDLDVSWQNINTSF